LADTFLKNAAAGPMNLGILAGKPHHRFGQGPFIIASNTMMPLG